jgi:hypothetical protein
MSFMPSVIYAEYRKQAHYAERHSAERRYAECRCVIFSFVKQNRFSFTEGTNFLLFA